MGGRGPFGVAVGVNASDVSLDRYHHVTRNVPYARGVRERPGIVPVTATIPFRAGADDGCQPTTAGAGVWASSGSAGSASRTMVKPVRP